MSAHFNEAEIRELCMGDPPAERMPQALAAFNGFSDLFGRGWIDQFFERGRDNFRAHFISSLWIDWVAIRDLTEAAQLITRWRGGPNANGVAIEVRILAGVARLCPRLELFPRCEHSVPDFRLPDGRRWAYGEITHRGFSQIAERVSSVLQRIVTTVNAAMPMGKHGMLALLRELDDAEIDALVAEFAPHGSFAEHIARKAVEEERIEDMAAFKIIEADGVAGGPWIGTVAPEARQFVTMIEKSATGEQRQATVGMGLSDEGAQEILESEASQLPRDSAGVVIIHASGVVGGYRSWVPLIRRRFQPKINRRIGGVVLVETDYGRPQLPGDGVLLLNPHARFPLSDGTVQILAGLLRKEG